MTRLLALAGVAAVALYLFAHGLPAFLRPQARSHQVAVVLGDGSCDSTVYAHEQAVRLLRTAIHDLALQEGTVMADLVQSNAPTSMTFEFRHDFVPSPEIANGLDQRIDANLQAQAQEVSRTAGSAFRRPRVRCGTDLLGAFQVTANVLSPYAGRPKLVVVVSNMLEVGPEASFLHTPLTPAYIDRLIRHLRTTDQIPRLDGVRIAVVGAGLQPTADLSKQQEDGLRTFWEDYFGAANASIVAWQPNLTELPLG